MLPIVMGAFGITKGMVLICHTGDSTFELVAHQHLNFQTVESISQQLQAGIQDDLGEVDGLVELSSPRQSPSTPATLRQVMTDAGMTMMIVARVQQRLTVSVGLGPLLSQTPFAEHQIELLSALARHTEIALGNALLYQDILQENQQLKEALHQQSQFDDMVGGSPQMQAIYKRISQIAGYPNYSVLITGETGTGKELIAKSIHHHSPRKDKIFLPVNCAALPRELVESELFGHERGAFTGATVAKPGCFEAAAEGTLFLDEIAEMPTETQAKLLRALEQKEVRRVGGLSERPVDVRVIAATNKKMTEAIPDGEFREDLFYRFDVQIHTPPLRERKEDIPLLANRLLAEIARENQQPAKTISPDGLKALMNHDWPGNIRDLKKVLMQAVLVTENPTIRAKHIPFPQGKEQTIVQVGLSLKDSVEQLKCVMIEEALRQYDGNRTRAAAELGMTRQNLQNMMRRLPLRTDS